LLLSPSPLGERKASNSRMRGFVGAVLARLTVEVRAR